jgi:TRAP-type mannitol/chloroaromatic compound transport system permease large subunit
MVFVSIFLGLGGGEVVSKIILGLPLGRWGVFAMIMVIVFIMGFFMDWLGIVFILIPILAPIIPKLGFDPLWVAMMIIVNFQTSFMTPPFCPTIFVLQPILKPEWKITDGDLIKGVIPYVVLILVGLALCVAFPEIILWLPSTM